MSTVQIDKLLEYVVAQRVSDLHITTGQPPVVRESGRMIKLETKSLTGDAWDRLADATQSATGSKLRIPVSLHRSGWVRA